MTWELVYIGTLIAGFVGSVAVSIRDERRARVNDNVRRTLRIADQIGANPPTDPMRLAA